MARQLLCHKYNKVEQQKDHTAYLLRSLTLILYMCVLNLFNYTQQ